MPFTIGGPLYYSVYSATGANEVRIAIFIATAIGLAIVTAIQFSERGYRYKRLEHHKQAGTYGFEYHPNQTKRLY